MKCNLCFLDLDPAEIGCDLPDQSSAAKVSPHAEPEVKCLGFDLHIVS